ncbi:MAG: hypothetical protein H7Z41_16665 [Cytophagales bacterium]|nr:hypothetical protein [Armatimonadota bacterium]
MTPVTRTFFSAAIAATALVIPAFAAPLSSGLATGQSVSPFHPKHVSGPLKGTTECFPCTFENRPQVQAWINADDSKNVLPIAKSLGKAMKTYQGKEFKALVVFLTTPENAAKTEAAVRAAAKTPGTEGVGMAVLRTDDAAVSNYKVNTASGVKNTVFVYRNWKVADKFVNLKADAAGLKTLNQSIAKVTS